MTEKQDNADLAKGVPQSEEKALAIHASTVGAMEVPMGDVIVRASEIATNLAQIIKDKKLFTMIQGNAYVHVEGWTTLGALIGIFPKVREVKKHPGGYEALVDLVRVSDGQVVGGAGALCTIDEKTKAKFDPYALYSMAETRATGKAYRLAFSWIMKLAGYEVTPWEEMDGVVIEGDVTDVEPETVTPAKKKKVAWTDDVKQEVKAVWVEAGVVPQNAAWKHVTALMDLAPFGIDGGLGDWAEWGNIYRGLRDDEFKGKEKGLATKAATKATSIFFEGMDVETGY